MSIFRHAKAAQEIVSVSVPLLPFAPCSQLRHRSLLSPCARAVALLKYGLGACQGQEQIHSASPGPAGSIAAQPRGQTELIAAGGQLWAVPGLARGSQERQGTAGPGTGW